MSKGQNNRARQPVARVKGRETSQPRNPAGSGKPGGSSFIKSKPAQLPPGSGKQTPLGKKPASGRTVPGGAPFARRDERAPLERAPLERTRRDERAPLDRTRRDERAPYARDKREEVRPPRDERTPAPKVARAKKLMLRDPGQKMQERARQLRETRVDYDRIEPVRVQKALAQSGVGSRREMEEWIEAGLVLVNGKKATLGDKVGPHDRVTVKGSSIKLKWADRLPRVILYHKQEGEIVSRDDPQGRVTVFDRLPQAKSSRWVAVGRLDVNTSGLMIITTSGELANNMMHPSFEVEREYAVRVLGEVTDEQRREMCKEIELEDGPARFDRIIDQGGEGSNHWYRVVLKEGRNREVRRMFEHFGLQVSRLMRVRFGQIGLPPRLKRGQFYELNEVEVAAVMKWAHLTMTGGKPRR
ncbi:23S rRNA pseudouridine(2605) synthase RluB [Paludibacterium purpuratum]|uniref:Pseudouridine synthase n=1 Tax=Paludibacterium purpuratum TaxID=1144873 RepID=A0A4R7BCH3_9NEIS|nr:pseudouridine synthase [Paludibacterium purpuratum]TDR82648.1 ribosomal large subunit pseudouridine synthase B [Paludibacterium purpuratum]